MESPLKTESNQEKRCWPSQAGSILLTRDSWRPNDGENIALSRYKFVINFKYLKILKTVNFHIGGNSLSTPINLGGIQWIFWVVLLQKPQEKINCTYCAFVISCHTSVIQSLKYWLDLLPSKVEKPRFSSSAMRNSNFPRLYRKSVTQRPIAFTSPESHADAAISQLFFSICDQFFLL